MANEEFRERANDVIADAQELIKALEELLPRADRGEPGAVAALSEICAASRAPVVALRLGFSTLNPGQHQMSPRCALPHHNHTLGIRYYQCQYDSSHVFCRAHKLDRCVIQGCGGQLI
jgi:hypothetical protein